MSEADLLQGHMPGPLRLTIRGRLVVALLGLMAGLGLVWGAHANAAGYGQPLEVQVHIVAPGDTLWRYAAAMTEPGQDVREAVAWIKKLNRLDSADLVVGDRLLLPRGRAGGK